MKLRAPCVPSLSDPLELSTMTSKPCAALLAQPGEEPSDERSGLWDAPGETKWGRVSLRRAMIGDRWEKLWIIFFTLADYYSAHTASR